MSQYQDRRATAPPVAMEGSCDRRFAPVRDVFLENFLERGEVGAAVCVMAGGRVVVDLWGGWADPGCARQWQPDTLVNMFSVGKGLVAACAARLAGQGLLDVDAAVVSCWPEFGAADKGAVTIRQLLSHQAGLPAVRRRLPPGSMLDWQAMTGQEIAGPLGADVHIGLPASQHSRVAPVPWPDPLPVETEPAGLEPAQLMAYNAYFNPGGLSGAGVVNSPAWRAVEIPAANAHGTARGIARVYAALAAGGTLDGTAIADAAALAAATAEQAYGQDLVLGRPSRFGLGFQLTQPERPLGPGQAAFGHFGAGGSLGFCDPDSQIAFGYVMNQMGPRWQNPRTRALVDAVYACL